MFNAILAKLKAASRAAGGRPDRASVLLPFLIIAVGVGALAWRSYYLSHRMERGVATLAEQSAGYAAEITARRVDATVRAEMTRVAEDWQMMERRFAEPSFAMLSEWIKRHDWVVAAIYLPDYDPASSIYGAENPAVDESLPEGEFYTATGTVSYTYDPERLFRKVNVKRPLAQLLARGTGKSVQPQADVSLVRDVRGTGLQQLEDGFAFVAPLGAPLESYGVRAIVRTSYIGGPAWQNQRVISLWVSFLAVVLMGIGGILALRGLHKEAETTALRGALIANVSHELRTPLSMIRLGAETLRRGKLRDKERSDIEEQILREVLLLSHLVENVLDIARIQNRSTKALAFQPVYPQDLVENLIHTYESWIRSKGFEVDLYLDEEVEEQMWDRDAVSRALLNLVDNAIKYSGDDRTIDVILRQTEEHVILEVRDRGVGISARDAAKIFEPYFRARFSDTTTRRGAGLGLTLVQQIVESHGGRVEVESSPGKGSTFRLIFPRLVEDLEPVTEKQDSPEVVTRGTENYA